MMKKNIIRHCLPGLAMLTLVLASCGTGKKLESANARIAEQGAEMTRLQAEISNYQKQVAELQKVNDANRSDAEAFRAAQLLEKQKREKVEAELAKRGTSLQEIDEKMKKNVQDLKDVGCEVKYKEGRFFISVPDDFTFKSASAGLGPQSRQALNVVAQIMRDDPGYMATVVGNTDSLPMTGNADNWSLSTERANSVVRLLADSYGINPNRLTAAGRSQYSPIASNETPEGRAKNRRIEIIINPRLERLAELLDK